MPSTAPTPYALRTKFRESQVKMARTEDHTSLSLLPIPFPFPFFTGDPPCPTSPLRAMERTPAVTRRTDKDKALAAAAAAAAAMEEDGDAEMEEEAEGERLRPPPPPPLSTASAAVRARGAGGSGGAAYPICQADKCTADLTEAKRYHRRHKVCEAHAKAAAVIVAGLRQRFCQQCSRFHELSEFDEAKRSCRRRLAGHNERRRKSTSDPQGEGSSRCMQADQDGKVPISLPGNQNYKRFQIR